MLGRGGEEHGRLLLFVYFGQSGESEIEGHLIMWNIQSKSLNHCLCVIFWIKVLQRGSTYVYNGFC